MVAVHAGVADGKREGKGKCAVRLGIFPEGEKREKIGRAAVINGAIRRIIEPRHAGDAEEIRRLSLLHLDALFILILLRVRDKILIKSVKIRIIFAPDIRKGLVILVEDGEIRVEVGIIAGGAVLVHSGTHFGDGRNDLSCQSGKGREKFQIAPLHLRQKMRHIYPHGHAVDGFDKALGIILKMTAPCPIGREGGKGCLFHNISSFRLSRKQAFDLFRQKNKQTSSIG